MARVERLIFVNRLDQENIGDIHSAVFNYVEPLLPSVQIDIFDVIEFSFLEADAVIVGGGGLLGHGAFYNHILHLSRLKCKGKIAFLAGWGIGLNIHYAEDSALQLMIERPPFHLRTWDLIGTRDIDVACPSSLLPIFDEQLAIQPTHEIVAYRHKDFEMPSMPSAIPFTTNSSQHSSDILDIITFLASGNIIVTNTYHGALWGLFLSRRVILTSTFSTKFEHLKLHPDLVYAPDLDGIEIINLASQMVNRKQSIPSGHFLSAARVSNAKFLSTLISRIEASAVLEINSQLHSLKPDATLPDCGHYNYSELCDGSLCRFWLERSVRLQEPSILLLPSTTQINGASASTIFPLSKMLRLDLAEKEAIDSADKHRLFVENLVSRLKSLRFSTILER